MTYSNGFTRLCCTVALASLLGCSTGSQLMNGLQAGIKNPGGSVRSLVRGGNAPQASSTDAAVEGIESPVPRILNKIEAGDRVSVDSELGGDPFGIDELLLMSERGRIAQLQGDYPTSVREFKELIGKFREIEDRAKVRAGDIAAHGAALVVNDNVLPYEPAGFEKVLAYHFQALNYLMQGDVEAAGVEVRRANSEQELALKAHEAEMVRAQQEASEKSLSLENFTPGITQALGGAAKIGAGVKNSFQNAYTFYMSAVVHEVRGEPNDAYIDYKKALEIAPTNSFIKNDVQRLSQALGVSEESAPGGARVGVDGGSGTTETEVIVLFEEGLVPQKKAVRFPIPIPIPSAPGITSVAIPIYEAQAVSPRPLTLKANGATIVTSEPICRLDALAIKDYQENASAMIARQVVRAALKGGASSVASKYGGSLAGAAVGAVMLATEQADTRSWRSLPHNAQVLRTKVPAGAVVEIQLPLKGVSRTVQLPAEGGKRVIVRVTQFGSYLSVSQVAV
jgi:hypothetical protein